MNKIEQIKAEIERRFWDYGTPLHDDEVTKKVDEILSLIDSLPEEKPSEEKPTCKTCGFYENNCPFIRGKFIPYPSRVCKDYTYSVMKEQEQPASEPSENIGHSEDLEQAVWLLYPINLGQETLVGDLNKLSREAFKAGAEWQKEQESLHIPESYKENADSFTNDLEKAADEYGSDGTGFIDMTAFRAFKAGAKWQKEQFEKNRLAACDAQTAEEYERETAFATEIIEKEHRSPTFNDAINYGMRLQKEQDDKELSDLLTIAHLQGADQMKEQMMKGAEECELYWDGDFLAIDLNMRALGYSERDKVKIIIIKED